MADFTHFDDSGRSHMVDISAKADTLRTATAAGRVLVNGETFRLIQTGGMKKGDVLGAAQIAGIMAAKRTPDLIPMCHPILLKGVEVSLAMNQAELAVEITATVRCTGPTGVEVSFAMNEADLAVEITATVRCTGATGVEMEALTAVSAAALTVYDMCKAVQKDMVIDAIRLLKKSGGKSGDYTAKEETSHG